MTTTQPSAELTSVMQTLVGMITEVLGEEDFGIAAVEALACGAPVVALGLGGVLDIVTDGVNGVLYDEAGPEGLADAIRRASGIRFGYNDLRSSALSFSPERFQEEFRQALSTMMPSARSATRPAIQP